jgi:hypothetical protein
MDYVLGGGFDQHRILGRYRELAGFEETNPNAIWHQVVAQYGAPCSSCGKPLRRRARERARRAALRSLARIRFSKIKDPAVQRRMVS